MAKQTGLGAEFYIDGRDLSGDIGSLRRINGGPAVVLPVTGINKSAFERLGGNRTGGMGFESWFNPSAAQSHQTLKTLPTTDRIATYLHRPTLGVAAASCIGKQINYDPTRGQDGSLSLAIDLQSNGFGLEWGEQLTAGSDNFTGAAAGTGIDYGAAIGTTLFGIQAYLQVGAFTGTSATVAVQDSDDNGVDPWANLTGGVFAAASAVGAQRIQTARDLSVKRWLRINVTGTFSNLDIVVMVVKNTVSVVF